MKAILILICLAVPVCLCPLPALGQSLTPLQQAGYAPVWQEDFDDMTIPSMQWGYAYGPGEYINNYVIPNAAHLGQFVTPSATEHQINHFKMSAAEPRSQTIEFDLYATYSGPNPGSARIFVRPHRGERGVFIFLYDTRVEFYNPDGSGQHITIPWDLEVGLAKWAHIVVSFHQNETRDQLEAVVAINEEVKQRTMDSLGQSLDTLWNTDGEVWSLEYCQGTKETGFYIRNVRGYQPFLDKTAVENALAGRVVPHLASLATPSKNNGYKLLMRPDLASEIAHKKPLALAYVHRLQGREVTFDGGSSQAWYPITSYRWDFGDNTTGSGKIVNHTFQKDGTYDVTLTVTQATGTITTDTETTRVTVSGAANPSPTFADVPFDHPYHDDIEALYQAGYTAGCSTDPLLFCPSATMNRAESAVFVERGIHGTAFVPTAPLSQVFADLALDSWAANWVNGLWQDKYTAGCGTNPLVYCPWQGHSRAEGTVFYLRMLNGASFEPPQPIQQTFADVPLDAWYAKWVRAAYDAGLIPACQTAPDLRFCPNDPLTRAVAAYMMVKAKGLIPADRIEFTPSNEDFANPERGFMRQVEIWPDGTGWPGGLSQPRDPSDTMVWIYFRLDNYRTKPLDEAALTRIGAAFDVAKGAGLKVVARFIYNWGNGGSWSPDPSTWAPDATLDQVLEHINQLKPLLASHADTLAALQAGFVGHWGEWHSSKNDLTSPANQIAIINALLNAVPSERMLQLRYPADKETHFGGPLSEVDAYSGSAASRIGHHNDCFLASDDDEGTYRTAPLSSPSEETIAFWKDFIAKEGRFTPVGGETCSENPPRSLCPTALNELEMLHWSFINNGYNEAVLNSWAAGGCMDTIRLRLGYRLVLTEAVLPRAVRPGGAFDLQFRLRNDGFAAMYNPRPVFAVLDGAGARYEFPLENVDPRRWGSGTTQSITTRLQLPPSIPSGTYRLSLWLPDPAVSLRNDPRFAVRFANAQVWDASSGLNVLTTTFTVAAESPALLDTTALGLRGLPR